MADAHGRQVVILGASARAAAQSARRAGLEPWCIDLFADRDLQAIAPVMQCPADQYPQAMVQLVRDHAPPGAPLLFTGAMENATQVIAALEQLRPTLHASAADIARLRRCHTSPGIAPGILPTISGVGWCETHDLLDMEAAVAFIEEHLAGQARWIIKPIASASGSRVAMVRDAASIHWPARVQRFIEGIPLGAVWRSHDGRCQLLGVTRQIIGDDCFGVTGFRYAGSIGPFTLTDQQTRSLAELGLHLTRQFHLKGIWGGDVMLDANGLLWPIEFNPRYTASVEVLEKACDFAALDPRSHPRPPEAPEKIHGKVYVFARQPGVAPDLYDLFPAHAVADLPAVSSTLHARQPICTLLAQSADDDSCLSLLRTMADSLYTRLR